MASAHLRPCQQQGDRLTISIPSQLRLTKSQPNLQLNDRSNSTIEKNPMESDARSQFVGLGEDEGILQERCMILVRERYRRHRYIEKLKKRINTLEYHQQHFIRMYSTDDIPALKVLRNELQTILEEIKVGKVGSEAVLRQAVNPTTFSPRKDGPEDRSANPLSRPFSTMFSSTKHQADLLIPPRRARSMNPGLGPMAQAKEKWIDAWRRRTAEPTNVRELSSSHGDTQNIFLSASFHQPERQPEPRRNEAPFGKQEPVATPMNAVSPSRPSFPKPALLQLHRRRTFGFATHCPHRRR
ncbi:hypothetical protein C351_07018 [Cryptococcus neoformans c8]|nr:hypothetical protein C353_07034 [Cryptococcus neoformans var. grubii AD1-83a]OXG42205.1 hypothetical protein C354_07014 [Cryptococcus neoformans var. grubii MW-RSA1955]OXG46779.1 hypothetical protein C352_07039 [Cryptococcus neoformans var. grubii CHC193]OXG55898.1 hypothetical protein C351_07018 [Cryptococcus neoformans var. grubii c8]OXH00630.1 hypothetical protein C369_07148 [Cryptococcus neoformans var. grubii A5-35-17]OXH01707.1 hypothetical protein C370_07151 [Cryptococcus neoformans 